MCAERQDSNHLALVVDNTVPKIDALLVYAVSSYVPNQAVVTVSLSSNEISMVTMTKVLSPYENTHIRLDQKEEKIYVIIYINTKNKRVPLKQEVKNISTHFSQHGFDPIMAAMPK